MKPEGEWWNRRGILSLASAIGLGATVGVNLSKVLYDDLCRDRQLACRQSADEVCWVAEDGFLLSVASNLRRRRQGWSLYADILRRKKTGAVFRWRDPLPALSLLGWGVADFVVRALGFVARKAGLR